MGLGRFPPFTPTCSHQPPRVLLFFFNLILYLEACILLATVHREKSNMTASDRTTEFRELVKEASQARPDAKRSRPPKRAVDGQRDGQEVLNKQYLAEGNAIVSQG